MGEAKRRKEAAAKGIGSYPSDRAKNLAPGGLKGGHDINDLDDVVCPICGCMVFQAAIRIKRRSPILSKSGREDMLMHQVFVCMGRIPEKVEVDMGDGSIQEHEVFEPCGHIIEISNDTTYTIKPKEPPPEK